jgi:hypothetical protein
VYYTEDDIEILKREFIVWKRIFKRFKLTYSYLGCVYIVFLFTLI